MNKTCSMCGESKSLELFASTSNHVSYKLLDQKNRPTHKSRCRPCEALAAREWRKKNPGYRGTGRFKNIPAEDRLLVSAIGERLTQARERTNKYNQPAMDIDTDYLHQLFKDQGGNCALSGAVLKIEKRAVTCLSLDQKTPGLGYVKGNVQWVAWAINRAKGDMQQDVFIDMCKQVCDCQKVQRLS